MLSVEAHLELPVTVLTIHIPDALVSLGTLPSPIPSVLSFSHLILWTGAPQAQGAITTLVLRMGSYSAEVRTPHRPVVPDSATPDGKDSVQGI